MLQNVIGLISYYLSPTPVNLSDRGRGNVGKAIVSGTWIDHSIKVHRNRGNFVSGIFPFFFFFRRLKERKKKRNLVSCKANSWWLVRRRVFRERLREEWRIPLPQKSRNNTRSSHSGDAVLGTEVCDTPASICIHTGQFRHEKKKDTIIVEMLRSIGGTWIWMREKKNSHALYVAGWNFNLHRNKLGIRCCAELDCFSIVRHKGERLVELRNFNRRGGKKSKKMVTRGGLSMLGCTRKKSHYWWYWNLCAWSRRSSFRPIARTQLSSNFYLSIHQTYGRNPRIDAIFCKTIAQGRGSLFLPGYAIDQTFCRFDVNEICSSDDKWNFKYPEILCLLRCLLNNLNTALYFCRSFSSKCNNKADTFNIG